MIRVGSAEDHGLALDVIQIDGGTQSRANVNQAVVDDYAAAVKDGATFPPIVVFYDGKKHWLADGFHRFHAYQKAGKSRVAADVRQGTRRDAILHSVGANASHGLRRTNDDKRRAVLTLLADEEWAAKPERWIATTANVSHTFVQKIRAAHLATLPDRPAEVEVERGGTVYMQKVLNTRATAASAPQQGGDEKQEITPETHAPQGVEGGDEPVSAVEGTTSRNGFDILVADWTIATPEDRDAFIAYLRVCGVIPSNTERPAIPAAPDGEPGIPTVDARGAGRGEVAPDVFPQSIEAVTNSNRPRGNGPEPKAGEEADAASTPTAPAINSEISLERGAEQASAISDTSVSSSVGARQAVPHSICGSQQARAPVSDPLDPGPIPSFMDRRAKKESAA